MKVRSLLNLISQHLDEYSQYQTDYVMQVLHKYTLRKLYGLLDKITQHGKYELNNSYDHSQLKSFLEEFYAIVKNTDALPLHTPNTSISKVMMQVAMMLENFFVNHNRFELLMPSIKGIDYIISGTLLRDPKLKLNDFVTNDGNTCLIEILNCLKFASEDGVLKHTCLFDGKVKTLSDSEKQRVINHSKEAKEYWEAIQNKIQITLLGENFGAILMRLVEDLRKGGEHANSDGDPFNSGVDANVGILNFFIWHDALSKVDKTYLASKKTKAVSHGKVIELQEIFERLRRPHNTDYQETRFCVEILAQQIEMVVKYNIDLFERHPQNATARTIRIKLVTDAVANAELRLTRALANPNYKVTATYYARKSSSLLFNNLSRLHDLRDYVGNESLEKMHMQKQDRSVCFITKRRTAINLEAESEHRVRRQRTRYLQD